MILTGVFTGREGRKEGIKQASKQHVLFSDRQNMTHADRCCRLLLLTNGLGSTTQLVPAQNTGRPLSARVSMKNRILAERPPICVRVQHALLGDITTSMSQSAGNRERRIRQSLHTTSMSNSAGNQDRGARQSLCTINRNIVQKCFPTNARLTLEPASEACIH